MFSFHRRALIVVLLGLLPLTLVAAEGRAEESRRLLYVATPGIRNYLDFGGKGLLVFDIDDGHRFVRRIPTGGVDADGNVLNVKGICASAQTRRIYVSTIKSLMCFDLLSDKMLWEKSYPGGCDRMSMTPDGKAIYLPSLESNHWHVVDAMSGDVISKIVPNSGAHNTIVGPSGKWAYLAGLRSPMLTVADTSTHTAAKTVGPFTKPIRPFTVNGSETLVYVNINELLGFEIGDLKTGKMLHRVEVSGFNKGPTKRHGCPSHGVALTRNEKEVWIADAHNSRLHIFDNTTMPPRQVTSIAVREQPGWVSFSIDGRLAYSSTGEVIDVASKKIVAALEDETKSEVHSEKLLEIDFKNGVPVAAGNQFGIGGVMERDEARAGSR